MLVLGRKVGQSIFIGKDKKIQLMIMGIKDSQVRIGIEAPRDMEVHREEVIDRILKQEMEGACENV